jgi:methylmalonyl-CoA mutase
LPKWDKTDTIGAKVVATGYADVGFDVTFHFSKLLPKPPNKRLKMMHYFGVSSLAAGHKTLVPWH